MIYIVNAIIKGIIEGVTEFLPISSTGHLVLVRDYFHLTGNPDDVKRLDELFDIAVQFPAILAIVILFRQRLWASVSGIGKRPEATRFWAGLILAFIPAAIIGLLFHKKIEEVLMHDLPVAIALIVGGIILILVEKLSKSEGEITKAEDVSLPKAFLIGCFQCFGMVPGTSRSASTIIGGRFLGLTRTAAAEFSFFLALPTLGAACAYKIYKEYSHINWASDAGVLIAGSIASFLSAWLVVAFFIKFLQRYSLAAFGYYRIVLGAIVLLKVATQPH